MNSLVKDNDEYLKDLYVNTLKYLNNLWYEPKIVAKLLLNSDIEDVNIILAPFFCHNFYQNIISPYTVEENLLYVICLMLKEEINNLNSIDQLNDFLKKTPCGYLLGELRNKSDIKSYSKAVIYKIIEEVEAKTSQKKLNLAVINIENDIKNIEKELKKKSKDLDNIEDIIFLKDIDNSLRGEYNIDNFNAYKIRNQKEDAYFNDKYITNLTKNELEKIADKYKNQKNMYEYILKNKNKLNDNDNFYSNEKLINKIYKSKYSKILYLLYQIDFLKIIRLMDLLINSIIESIKILPKSIKYICKTISILIKKKFPDILKVEQNAFISKFVFTNLLIPIFKNPIDIYFNDFIISQNTKFNLNYFLTIFNQLILGNFINNKENPFHYTPFNWYFIDTMPKIFELFEGMTQIKFPNFLEKLIKDQLSVDYNYEYFNENPNQMIFHKSICFTLNDLSCLLENMNKCQNLLFSEIINNNNNNNNKDNNPNNDENNIINNNNDENNIINDNNDEKNKKNKKNDNILKLYNIFKKLNSKTYKNFIKSTKELNDFEIINDNSTIIPNIILISELLINPKYENLFKIKQGKPYFCLNELNKIENDEDKIKNCIIKTKNYICGLLYNCRDIEKTDFTSKNNTLEILKEIRIFLKSNEFVIDNTLPFEWYIKSLVDCFEKIPKKLKENDYELLYNELENDINKSIEFYDFYKMSDCFGKIKYIKKAIDYYIQAKNNINDIDLNLKVQNIIENENIPIEISFKYNNIEKEFLLLKPPIIEHKIEELMLLQYKKNKRICLNIEQFIKYFPNFVKWQLKNEIEILNVINELGIPKKINDYINYIVTNINKDKIFNKDEFIKAKEKLFDYMLNKLYYKLYPAYPEKKDIDLLTNCYKLSWTESHNFIEKKNNKEHKNYDMFMDEIKEFFTKLEKEKSPRKKLLIINDIFNTINNILKFNGQNEKDGGADILTAILMYIFVRVQPNRIYSDIQFIKLFIIDKTNIQQYQLDNLENICINLKNITHEQLCGITEEEFNQKCYSTLHKNI